MNEFMQGTQQPMLPAQQTQANWGYNQQWNRPMQPQMQMPQTPPPQELPIIAVAVNSVEEAQQFPIAPGRTVFLIDYGGRQFWLKRKDEMGLMVSFVHHTFTADGDNNPEPQSNANLVTRDEFEELKKLVDELTK